MIEVGIEIAAMTVERKLPRKISTTSDASSEPENQVLLQAATPRPG